MAGIVTWASVTLPDTMLSQGQGVCQAGGITGAMKLHKKEQEQPGVWEAAECMSWGLTSCKLRPGQCGRVQLMGSGIWTQISK